MDIFSAARLLGGDALNRTTLVCPGPGHSVKDRSLSVTLDHTAPDGFVVYSFAKDDWQVCREHVRILLHLAPFESASKRSGLLPMRNAGPAPDTGADRKLECARSLWLEGKPIAGTLVERYLLGRGIVRSANTSGDHAIRFHPACPFKLSSGETMHLPTMIGAMVNIRTSAFQGIHRTALAADGNGKAQVVGLHDAKRMLGSSKDAVVRLSPDEDLTHGLAIAEGIETALSVAGNFGFGPIWSTLSAGALARFPVLLGVECLSIFADNDAAKKQGQGLHQAGNEAARQCAARWIAHGRDCRIWMPPVIGSDFNDIVGAAA